MAHRVYNFNPGPSTLPLDVLKKVQEELLDYKGTGMSVMEISHRSAEYEEINNATIALTRELMGLDDKFHVLFLTGGASTQFAMIPLNFAHGGKKGAYIDTGSWSSKAIKEANLLGGSHVAASSKGDQYRYIPKESDIKIPPDAAYLHITTNNTIFGTQWQATPKITGVPLIADMSSDILSRRWDFAKYSFIYGGAQKNLGPSGVTLVVIHDDLLQKCKDGNPTMWDYRTHAKEKSLYNTPPSFGVYIIKLVLEWVNHVDLHRIKGVAGQYSDLLEASGVDTVPELAQRNAAHLFEKIQAVNAEKKLVRRLPTQKQVSNWIEQAKDLPRVVTY